MKPLAYASLNESLIEACPELAAELEGERGGRFGEEPGPHVVYGDLIAGHLVRLATQPDSEDVIGRRDGALAFLERLACDPDFEVRCVAQVSVLESVLDSPGAFCRLEAGMGPCTIRLVHEVARSWGRTVEELRRPRMRKADRTGGTGSSAGAGPGRAPDPRA